jgi:hypothetical protein
MKSCIRWANTWVFGFALILWCAQVQAHKASDAYLQIDANSADVSLRWDIALRDLDAALDIDTNQNGQLAWGEVKCAFKPTPWRG